MLGQQAGDERFAHSAFFPANEVNGAHACGSLVVRCEVLCADYMEKKSESGQCYALVRTKKAPLAPYPHMTNRTKRAWAQARAFRNKRADSADASQKMQKMTRTGKRAARDEDLDDAPQIEAPRKPRFAPVTFSEEGGVRYLHFGTEWVQGAMRLRKPDHIELEYARQMMGWLLFVDAPEQVVQLGLGSAALTKFCYRFLPTTRTQAVELN